MSSPLIEAFLFDDKNLEKFALHGLSWEQVDQILDRQYAIARNRKNRRGIYLLIGKDDGGHCLAVPIGPTYEVNVWRPITAWPCKKSEWAKLHKR